MTLKALELTKEERGELETLAKGRRDWRTRDRLRTILMFSEGVPAKEIAKRQELTLEAVYERRYRWLESGVASLSDAPRSGAPPKLSQKHIEQLKAWASEEALTATTLLTRLEEQFGIRVHRNTLTAALKQAGLVWKRTRHSLKKSAMTSSSDKPRQKLGSWSSRPNAARSNSRTSTKLASRKRSRTAAPGRPSGSDT